MASELPPPINSNSNRYMSSNLSSQTISFVTNSTISVKIFCALVFVGYVLSFKESAVTYLSVIPGKLLPPNFHIWSLVTHSFIEVRFFHLVADYVIILLYSRMIEPLWGVYECVLFYFVITSLVAIFTSLFYYIVFAFTFKEYFLFDIHINGLGGLLGGFVVAIKQIMPDTVIINASFIRLKQDHLPGLLILTSCVLYLFGLTSLTYVVMLVQGTFIGWVYLRFYQRHKNGTKGDSASSFVFASFFPGQIQPIIAIIANTIFNLLVQIKICKKPPTRYNVNGNGQSQITITLPLVNAGIENSDAERRRQKALKALKERLKKPGEDVADQWADRNSSDTVPLISNEVNEVETDSKPAESAATEVLNKQAPQE